MPYRVGIIGGGQLAKMLALSGLSLGMDLSILERKTDGVALNLAKYPLIGDWNNVNDLLRLAQHADVLTLEHEFVDAPSLAQLENAGHRLLPSSESVALVQDKLLQKQTLQKAGLPLPDFQAIASIQDLHTVAKKFGLPIVLKKRRNGYDGKGNFTIKHSHEIETAWAQLEGDLNALYVENFCPFDAELAIIITTGQQGETAIYPLVESVQKNHICHIVRAPATLSDTITAQAIDIAKTAISTVGAVGSFAVEMFLTNNEIMINELAPRVHNSGHYTIEACRCSQFENHLRAILGLPLGSTEMLQPSAVMVNLLGQHTSDGKIIGLENALKIEQVAVHIYGKSTTTKGRKMGHITALGNTIAEAEKTAQKAVDCVHFGSIDANAK